LAWFSLLLGLLADTGLVTIHYTIQSKLSSKIYKLNFLYEQSAIQIKLQNNIYAYI
jgi:hypothetical protein